MDYSLISWLKPWEDLMPGQAEAFLRELHAELSRKHPLHGLKLTALAHSRAADDVLFQMEGGPVVQVHLTWSGHPERPPWPDHNVYDSLQEWVQQVMIPAHEDH